MMNIAIAQSGGPTCAINASLVGAFKEALKEEKVDAIFGSINGIEGLIENHLIDLKEMIRSTYDMDLLRQTPSTVLGSCRYKLPDWKQDESVYQRILENLNSRQIGAFFYIGGNDSMDTVNKLSEYFSKKNVNIKVIGIPKTIDNDLCVTDHTPGFGSAAKYVVTTMKEIVRDSLVYSIPSVTIVEIMGRHAGWLTASSAILHHFGEAAPHLIYVPEAKFTVDKFLTDVRHEMSKRQAVIIAVSEGVSVPEDVLSGVVDNFGHKYLSGIGKYLEGVIRNEIGCKVRSIELNVMQRCSSHLASRTDIIEAENIAAEGVKCALNGESGKVMVFKRVSDMPYTVAIESVSADQVANKEKFLPKSFVSSMQNNIDDSALQYFLPLIQGEIGVIMDEGVPCHFTIRDTILS